MGGLIEEIQRNALDTRVQVDSLLRQVKLAAAKLRLSNLEDWVELELGGYSGRELPDYRLVWGEPAAWNPYNGWIPIHSNDAKFLNTISKAPLREPIASLQDIVARTPSGPLHYPIPAEVVAYLNQRMDFQTPRMVVQIHRGNIVTILDYVRNLALNWTIEMEKKGVMGSDFSFNEQEKQNAQAAMQTVNIGNIGSMIGNLWIGNTSGDIVVKREVFRSISLKIAKIKQSSSKLAEAGVDAMRLNAAIGALEGELSRKQPDGSRVRTFLDDLRAALSGASGNLIAEGALALVAAATQALGGN